MDDAAFEQGVNELLAVDGLDTSPAGDRSMWGFKVNVRAKSLSDAGLDVLASLNPTQWEEFESLAVAGWSPNADRMLVRVVSDCANRDNWQAGNKIKLANLKPKPNEIASMTRAGDSEERTIARMVARLAVLRRLNEMINDAIMPAVDLSNLQSTMPGCCSIAGARSTVRYRPVIICLSGSSICEHQAVSRLGLFAASCQCLTE